MMHRMLVELLRARPWLDRLRYRRHRVTLRVLEDETAGQTPSCATCTDHCCKHPHTVSLRLADVARLKDAGHDAAIVPPRGPQREPTLKQREDGICVFLDGAQRCTIYELRPIVCRRFPYYVDEDASRLRFAESCRSRTHGDATELRNAAVDSYNQRASDHLLVRRKHEELLALGLVFPSAFQAVLGRK